MDFGLLFGSRNVWLTSRDRNVFNWNKFHMDSYFSILYLLWKLRNTYLTNVVNFDYCYRCFGTLCDCSFMSIRYTDLCTRCTDASLRTFARPWYSTSMHIFDLLTLDFMNIFVFRNQLKIVCQNFVVLIMIHGMNIENNLPTIN
jgi:hypothetical protein